MTIEQRRRIGVFSHGGTKNLGDEALLAAVIQNVRLRVPDADILGFTINPRDSEARHRIRAYPIRQFSGGPAVDLSSESQPASAQTAPQGEKRPSALKSMLAAIPGLRAAVAGLREVASILRSVLGEPKFLWDSYRRLKGVDLLLVAGSQQLNDGYGGAWGFPYTLYKWTWLAKRTGTKVAILSVGAGPIDSPLSKWFIRRVLRRVEYRSYRDAISSRLMETLRVKGQHPVFPDLVYSLRLPAARPIRTAEAKTVVGTNPVPFFDGRYWPTSDPIRYEDYVRKFARFAEWLDKTGHSVLFFPTQVRADSLTIGDIRAAMNGSANLPNMLAGQKIQVLEDLVSEISRADLVIANRYHGILISLMMNKPVLGVAYHEKSRALLAQVGQGDFVLNIADFKAEDLIERFTALEANADSIKQQIAAAMAPLRRALDHQYDIVLSLIGVVPADARPS